MMRKVMRWRYYCDHCKRVAGSMRSMEKHERGCTNNPNRVCGLCGIIGNVQASIEQLETMPLKDLADLTEGCPACILAAIRMRYKKPDQLSKADSDFIGDFDFKKEMKNFWDAYNEANRPQY